MLPDGSCSFFALLQLPHKNCAASMERDKPRTVVSAQHGGGISGEPGDSTVIFGHVVMICHACLKCKTSIYNHYIIIWYWYIYIYQLWVGGLKSSKSPNGLSFMATAHLWSRPNHEIFGVFEGPPVKLWLLSSRRQPMTWPENSPDLGWVKIGVTGVTGGKMFQETIDFSS